MMILIYIVNLNYTFMILLNVYNSVNKNKYNSVNVYNRYPYRGLSNPFAELFRLLKINCGKTVHQSNPRKLLYH